MVSARLQEQTFQPNGPATAPDPSVAVLVLDSAWYDKVKSNQAPQLSNYVGTKYPMRWWFPEDTYRNFIPSTWDELDPAKPTKDDGTPNYAKDSAGKTPQSPRAPDSRARSTPSSIRCPRRRSRARCGNTSSIASPTPPLGSTDMAVFVRKDLVERYNYLASLSLPNYESLHVALSESSQSVVSAVSEGDVCWKLRSIAAPPRASRFSTRR